MLPFFVGLLHHQGIFQDDSTCLGRVANLFWCELVCLHKRERSGLDCLKLSSSYFIKP